MLPQAKELRSTPYQFNSFFWMARDKILGASWTGIPVWPSAKVVLSKQPAKRRQRWRVLLKKRNNATISNFCIDNLETTSTKQNVKFSKIVGKIFNMSHGKFLDTAVSELSSTAKCHIIEHIAHSSVCPHTFLVRKWLHSLIILGVII